MAYIETQIYKVLGNHLRNSREAAGLTLTNVADKLSATPMTIQRYEKGDRKITIEKIRLLCALYNVDADQLMQDSIDQSAVDRVDADDGANGHQIKSGELIRSCRKEAALTMSGVYMQEIMNRIEGRRLELGYTFQKLAELTHMSKSTLQRYESGAIKNIPLDKLEILASALQVSPDWLMGWERSCSLASDYTITAINDMLRNRDDKTKDRVLSLITEFLICDDFDRGRIISFASRLSEEYDVPGPHEYRGPHEDLVRQIAQKDIEDTYNKMIKEARALEKATQAMDAQKKHPAK